MLFANLSTLSVKLSITSIAHKNVSAHVQMKYGTLIIFQQKAEYSFFVQIIEYTLS